MIQCIVVILECFEIGKNLFEQLCINFVNEKVREFCTNRLIEEEMNWYKGEGLDIPQINFLDNRQIIGKPLIDTILK